MYSYSFDEENFGYEEFTTIEEALKAAKADALRNCPTEKTVYIGEVGEFEPIVDGGQVLDQLECNADEQCGDSADNYLTGVDEKDEDELTEMLTATYHKWEKKHHQEPNFYPIINVQEFEIGGDDDA